MQTQTKNTQKEIGQYVAEDFRTAAVFTKYKIDFCCNGNRTVDEACEKMGLDSCAITQELEMVLNSNTNQGYDYNAWSLDKLIEYIEKKHHAYVQEKSPILRLFLEKLGKVHGERHPELLYIKTLFYRCSDELSLHMKKEEIILFPYINEMVNAKKEQRAVKPSVFGTVKHPIASMMQEHENEGERLRKIAELTNNYTPPADACNTYKVAFAMLKEFEEDLHVHIHLENNILFPKALELENELE